MLLTANYLSCLMLYIILLSICNLKGIFSSLVESFTHCLYLFFVHQVKTLLTVGTCILLYNPPPVKSGSRGTHHKQSALEGEIHLFYLNVVAETNLYNNYFFCNPNNSWVIYQKYKLQNNDILNGLDTTYLKLL